MREEDMPASSFECFLERNQSAACRQIFTSNLPKQYAISEGLHKIGGSCLLCDVAWIVDLEQDIRINCGHAVILE
jgi:hypothetical protein